MCWIGRLKDRRIAEKDVTVYKILSKDMDGNYTAPYRHTRYAIGKKYMVEVKPYHSGFSYDNCHIHEGLHSFSGNCLVQYGSTVDAYIYNERVQFLYSINVCLTSLAVIAKCTIPQGSEYYQNEHGEIVSEELIINEVYESLPYLRVRFKEMAEKRDYLVVYGKTK